MQTFFYNGEFFSPEQTLGCGQTFRWHRKEGGWMVFSADKACLLENAEGQVRLTLREEDAEYFRNYFDLSRDYAAVIARSKSCGSDAVARAAAFGQGIRILNQDPEEVIFTFLLSQNNNIPRIRGMVERLCEALGELRTFAGEEYFTFPRALSVAAKGEDFFRTLGFGYRAEFIAETARILSAESAGEWATLSTPQLREKLLILPGVGPKVADCILLFGYHRTDAFPVDTWLEKVFRDEFGGKEKDRRKIAEFFCRKFGQDGGYIQQYLFYAKREGAL